MGIFSRKHDGEDMKVFMSEYEKITQSQKSIIDGQKDLIEFYEKRLQDTERRARDAEARSRFLERFLSCLGFDAGFIAGGSLQWPERVSRLFDISPVRDAREIKARIADTPEGSDIPAMADMAARKIFPHPDLDTEETDDPGSQGSVREFHPEDPAERRDFDRWAKLDGGPMTKISRTLLQYANTFPAEGSLARSLVVMSNEAARAAGRLGERPS